VFANRNGGTAQSANATFTNVVGVVQSPTDFQPMPQYALYMNGAASDQLWTGNTCETLSNFLFPADAQPHDINVVIRTRPFTVTTGTPYRMNLNINASAGANGGYPENPETQPPVSNTESYVDFIDPKLVTSLDYLTIKDQNGKTVSLSPSGFLLKTTDSGGNAVFTPLGQGVASTYTVTLLRTPVAIDLMNLFKPATISLWPSWELIPVAMLSTKDFNAPATINRRSLTFGATGDEKSLVSCDRWQWDINHDKRSDLLCYFQKQKMAFALGNTQAILKGTTVQGTAIQGIHSVRIVPSLWPTR
jgi:hypothetical protein